METRAAARLVVSCYYRSMPCRSLMRDAKQPELQGLSVTDFQSDEKEFSDMLNITKTIEDQSMMISLEGRLDTITAVELEQAIKGSLGGIKELTLDLEKLDYISSAGLRVLLATQKRMNNQGTMKLIHVGDVVMEVFEVTGFTDILTIEA